MGRSEREPLDPPIDAAIRWLQNDERPSDPMLGEFVNGSFIPAPRQDVQRPMRISPVRRILRVAGLA